MVVLLSNAYYVYIVRCEDGSIYTGSAKNLRARLKEHLMGKGAKYTKSHKPVSLELSYLCKDRSSALKLEYRIKQLTKETKELLIIKKSNIHILFNEVLDVKCYKMLNNAKVKEINHLIFIDFAKKL